MRRNFYEEYLEPVINASERGTIEYYKTKEVLKRIIKCDLVQMQ